jgi:hypothetical protein
MKIKPIHAFLAWVVLFGACWFTGGLVGTGVLAVLRLFSDAPEPFFTGYLVGGIIGGGLAAAASAAANEKSS